MDVLVAEAREVGPELVFAGDETDVDLVDEAMLALLLELRLRLLGLVGSDEVLLQSLVDHLEAGRDRRRVVGRAVLAEQELKDVDGDVGADLHLADEVLPDDPARERVVGQAVERVHRRAGGGGHFAHSSSSSTTILADTLASAPPRRTPVRASSTSISTVVSRSRFAVTWNVSTGDGPSARRATEPVAAS